MAMISYAQNGEDVVLARAFAPGYLGFYVDIGASDPIVDSVTKHFYDNGWSGINVEPAALAVEAIEHDRPRDVNLAVGISDTSGEATFYELPREMTGCSSFSADLAAEYEKEGWEVTPRPVRILTLAELFSEHVGERTVDFLKVDVEGHEPAVLAGADLERYRPRVIVVEATVPGTRLPAHAEWEPDLLAARYRCALFDGLNRFYVREEEPDLAEIIAAPANIFDGYITRQAAEWREWQERYERKAAEVGRQENEKQAVLRELQELNWRYREQGEALERNRAELARSDAHLRDVRAALDSTRGALFGALEGR